jgi:flavodoxin
MKVQQMKILIAYYTQTGNTEKIARAIFEETVSQKHEVHLRNIDDLEQANFKAYDLVFMGSACHDADLAEPVKIILDASAEAPPFKLAGFVTHATVPPEANERDRELYEKWAGRCAVTFEQMSHKKEIDLLGYFHCQGAPSPPIEEFIHNEIITDEGEWEDYIKEGREHPNEEDFAQAVDFARKVLLRHEKSSPS